MTDPRARGSTLIAINPITVEQYLKKHPMNIGQVGTNAANIPSRGTGATHIIVVTAHPIF